MDGVCEATVAPEVVNEPDARSAPRIRKGMDLAAGPFTTAVGTTSGRQSLRLPAPSTITRSPSSLTTNSCCSPPAPTRRGRSSSRHGGTTLTATTTAHHAPPALLAVPCHLRCHLAAPRHGLVGAHRGAERGIGSGIGCLIASPTLAPSRLARIEHALVGQQGRRGHSCCAHSSAHSSAHSTCALSCCSLPPVPIIALLPIRKEFAYLLVRKALSLERPLVER